MVKHDTLVSPQVKLKGNIWNLNFKYKPAIVIGQIILWRTESQSHPKKSYEAVKESLTNSQHKSIY
jgi:hypothetical protein